MKMKRFEKLLRKMSTITEEYIKLANILGNIFRGSVISKLDVQRELNFLTEVKGRRSYPKITIIYSILINEKIKMSYEDKRLYKELFKHYICSIDVKQINYPLILGLIYHEINRSTLLEPEYIKDSKPLIRSIHEWNNFIYNLKQRPIQQPYILQNKPIKAKTIRLNDI
jgi:hypothetical protein